jgi:protein required for attachment to host cells
MVADEAIARVLQRERGRRLETVRDFAHPAAHGRPADVLRDAHGRRAGNATVSAGTGDDVEYQEAEAFAREIAAWLEQKAQAGRYDALHVAAAPRFLGLLRKALKPATAKRVVKTHDKDWAQSNDAELLERFFADEPGAR